VRIGHIVCLHLLDILGVGHRHQHVLSRNTKRLAQYLASVRHVFKYLKNHHGIERPVLKWKNRVDIRHPNACASRPAEIFHIDIATETIQTLCRQGAAIGTKATSQVEHVLTGMPVRKAHKSAVMSSGFRRKTRLVVVVSRAGRHVRSGIINGLMVNKQNELIRSLRKQLEATERELANQKWVFDQFMKSPSWRLTYPIRWLAQQIRSLRDRLVGKQHPAEVPEVAQNAESDDTQIAETPLELKEFLTGLYRIQLQSFLITAEPLQLPQSSSPEISVILVLFNRAELTLVCLRSLAEHFCVPMEIIIVDNASQDETPRLLDQLKGARVIRNTENRNFLLAVNQAAREARGEYLLILNNDAQLLPGTLQSTLRTIRSAKDIGAVGGRLILLDGTLQEAGSIVWRNGSCLGYGRGDNPFAPMYMFRRDVDYCSGAFLMTPRTIWEQLGGFDERFKPAYYEETDYCMRLWEKGLRVVYDPNSVLLHYEFASSDSAKKATDLQREHQATFAARHHALLASQYTADMNHVLPARMKRRENRRVLFIDDRVPHTWLGSGFPRARTMLSALLNQKCFVTFYPFTIFDESWASVYSDMPNEIEFMIGYGPPLVEAFLRNRRGYYDIILVSRPHNMKMLKPVLEAHPEWFETCEVVYDAEAIFVTREITLRQLSGAPLSNGEVEMLFQEEVSLARAADLVLAVSASDADAFRKHGVEAVHVIGHCIEPRPTPRPFSERQGFLFVGAIHEEASPNGDSMIWFLDEVLPRIQAALGPDISVTVAGVNQSERIRQLAGPAVRITGHVADLTELYDTARVFIAPTRYAAGIPHKVHEAAAHGLPVVATPLLAKQLGWTDGEAFLVAGDAESFATSCIELHKDRDLWTKLRNAGLARIQSECSRAAFEESVGVMSRPKKVVRTPTGMRM
jgi:GT2 family glycosyltransferase